jgi:hypothetical protein
MRFLKEPKNAFTTGLFDLIDTDSTHELDFYEFAHALVTFACFTEDDLLKYCFYIFDKDKNGFIEMDELDFLLECLHEGGSEASLKAVTEQIDVDRDGRISMEEFTGLNKAFPFLLFPAFRFQQAIMRETFSMDYWMRKREKLAASRSRKDTVTSDVREKHRRDVLEVRFHKLGSQVGLLGVWAFKRMYGIRERMGTWANIKEERVELVNGAGFAPVPSALVEKVLHAGGKPAVAADDETPEGASRRALQEGNSDRRARQRERSIKRKKNRVEPLSTAAAPSPAPAQTAPDRTAPAQTAPALAPAPKAGHGRRWSQEANVFPAG